MIARRPNPIRSQPSRCSPARSQLGHASRSRPSRRRHTRLQGDWSSDVCSSDLGASLIYGFTGTVSFAGIAQAAGQGGLGLVFGIVFLFAGFCFKVSAVPFHMWTPDVYEGAPTPITAFFAAAPKVAGIAMFVRATIASFPGIVVQWQQIVVFVALASMALRALAPIRQH